jgi:mannose-6-phosphate isomerase
MSAEARILTESHPAPDLLDWLLSDALPLWAQHGVDRAGGGFYEKLGHDLAPIEEPRRARLVARQIYCFAVGGALGWDGEADALVAHGLDFLTRHLIRPDGTVVMAVEPDGRVARDRYDPYDQAFVLFALSAAAARQDDPTELRDIAARVRDRLSANWAHPVAGYEEASPRTLPLKQNPQMHLFEAFLAWAELMGDRDPSWQQHADALGQLALDRLISTETGALYEFFDGDWLPQADDKGLLVEPGHQFEWAWLLTRWAESRNDSTAFAAAVRLADIGEAHGVNARGVAFNELHHDFTVRDAHAKLWPQTERIKAWHALSLSPLNTAARRVRAADHLGRAVAGLRPFLVPQPRGLWHEVQRPDGSFIDEPVRASSLYHITCAIHTISAASDAPVTRRK